MTMKVLVALHPGYTHTPALERARALAAKTNIDVLLYSAVYDEHFAGRRFGDSTSMQTARNQMIGAVQEKLHQIEHLLTGLANSVTVRADWHYPAGQGIVAAAEDFGADLIVVSSTQHNAVARWMLTNTDWEVLRHAQVPVLFAHHRPFREYTTVLAAVDPMHTNDNPAALDDRIVIEGRRLSELFGGQLHLGHAYPSDRTNVDVDFMPPQKLLETWRVTHTDALQRLADKHGIAAEQLHLLDEVPSRAIPMLAETLSANLVVIGSVSRSFLKESWIGRTTEHTLDHLDCDVLTVKLPPV